MTKRDISSNETHEESGTGSNVKDEERDGEGYYQGEGSDIGSNVKAMEKTMSSNEKEEEVISKVREVILAGIRKMRKEILAEMWKIGKIILEVMRKMRNVISKVITKVREVINSIKFADNYCSASCKLSCKPVWGIKMAKRQLWIWHAVLALTANNKTSEAVESVFRGSIFAIKIKMHNQLFKLIKQSDRPWKRNKKQMSGYIKNLFSVDRLCPPEFLNVLQERRGAWGWGHMCSLKFQTQAQRYNWWGIIAPSICDFSMWYPVEHYL